ncbi:MAG: xanthine dehydrogenase family protein molybdopterin-binding subunit [Rhodospirillaceae bacterium]|jgi:aerobic carbon-monoxide dehydrogenase large subunit|nr:xanthine dehydrogenase family protein molybdopterin-binding subunit [Rhodospirillaceae bacterium]MBT5458382.1 xanthine dehydrogenase family protein molybdopterin-binding subunit [Rhodospirillaceae bacterium]
MTIETTSSGEAKAAMGEPVRRIEDERLVTGAGHFVDDLAPPGTVFAHVVRSPHAHARLLGIDTNAAAAAPGVLAVYTGADVIRENIAPLTCGSFPKLPPNSPSHNPTQPILAADKVRYVGEAIALVVAETLAQAKDAGELIHIEYTLLPAVTLRDAHAPDAPQVWDEADGNVSFRIESGDGNAVDQQFAAAAHVTEISVHYPRASANTMEPRGALAYRDPMDDRYTLCTSCQEPHEVKHVVSHLLGIPALNLRVVAMDVGGAFGMKGQVYPEEVLVLWAARNTGRPVKWTADRSEGLATDMHGRGPIAEAALALDSDGRILAFRTSVSVDVGAYLSGSAGVPPRNATISYPGTYHVPLIHALVRATFTNTTLLGPYRGSGKPEATYVLERLMEKAAREMDLDPIDMRRRNLISPSDMPYQTPGGYVYDSGHFERILDKAIDLADGQGFETRRADCEQRGLRRGRGLALHCQRAGTFSERMEIRVGQNGSVALHVGTLSTGQGHETMFAQMVSGWLGVPLDQIRVFQGDTDKVLFGRGTFAQRSMSAGGSALRRAADDVVSKGSRLSAWMLEVSEADIVFEDGLFRVAGTDREVSFREVAETSYMGAGLPSALGIGLDGVGTHDGTYSFPNGCMICEVEVDSETGTIRVDRLYAVDDVGVVVNPLTLEGQLHGSIAQGLGEALVEQIVYDRETGQLLTGSFMDYGMPRADMMPDIISELSLVPTGTNLLGVKGGSEAGNCGMPPAIIHAVLDALSPWGVTDIPIPATPERVWHAIHTA